jgi:hypothetical protein
MYQRLLGQNVRCKAGLKRGQHCFDTRYAARPNLEILEHRQLPSTFAVINTNDSGEGSLRQAILDANAHPAPNTIIFDIRPGGVQTIRPMSALPTITNPVVIDGTFQPGYAGRPLIVINGSEAGNVNGLTISAGNSTVRGLVINGYDGFLKAAILLQTHGGNVISGNFIGTDVEGVRRVPNSVGLRITADAPQNIIGGTAAYAGNLISGSDFWGISLSSNDNLAVGNFIGTDVTGIGSIPNSTGVYIVDGAQGNSIGGTDPGTANLISGNGSDGVFIASSDNNVVQGNMLGTDAAGLNRLGNGRGILVFNGIHNVIGGTRVGAGNLISGNALSGVFIQGGSDNQIQGNAIGTDIIGTHAVPNDVGITVWANTVIGGTAPGAGNLISGNRHDGVFMQAFSGTVLLSNRIGTDITGTQPLGNGDNGVTVLGSSGNAIGGTIARGGNVIAFNGGDGVLVTFFGVSNIIVRNAIFSNHGLGIELRDGGNHNQEAPVIDSATSVGGVTTVSGGLRSAQNTSYTVELFANTSCNHSGYGEGQRFFASLTLATDASGIANFTIAVALSLDPGTFITGTATDPQNNTSQFSACQEVTGDKSKAPVVASMLLGNETCGDCATPSVAIRLELEALQQPVLLPLHIADTSVQPHTSDAVFAAMRATQIKALCGLAEIDVLALPYEMC